jgi:fructokinase
MDSDHYSFPFCIVLAGYYINRIKPGNGTFFHFHNFDRRQVPSFIMAAEAAMSGAQFGAIEAGGTKFICLVGSSPEDIVAETRIPTTLPEETIGKAIDFFRPFTASGGLKAIGIASFGPIDLDTRSATFGYITSTPKPGWRTTNIVGPLREAFDVPVAFDTDVNAAAWGEQTWAPENRALDPFLYVTVGTGIGAGAIVNGMPIHGLMHMEAGHFLLRHDPADPFPGMCPFHGDCWEGLASGPAMAKRWGMPAEKLPDDHPGWDLEAEYTARAFANLIFAFSPRKIVLGGGVAQHPGLHAAVRRKVQRLLNGYIPAPALIEHMDSVIVPPALGLRSGVLGALALGMAKS